MFKKFETMNIKQKLNFGYMVVIIFMAISGLVSIIALSMLDNGLNSFINGSNTADTAVKICRIDINIAARSIREAALNEDTSSFEGYKQKVEERLAEVDSELQVMKDTGLIEDEIYQKYTDAIAAWGEAGWEILELIEAGKRDEAVDAILNECVPALDNLVEISKELDEITDEMMQDSITQSQITFYAGVVLIIVFIIVAVIVAMQIGKYIVKAITDPIAEIMDAAQKMRVGDLSVADQITYESEDELGTLAQTMRETIQTLDGYVKEIAENFEQVAKGDLTKDFDEITNFLGDFASIKQSFVYILF